MSKIIIVIGKIFLTKDENGERPLFKLFFPVIATLTGILCIIFTFIIFLIATPLGNVLSILTGQDLELPEGVKDLKGQTHYLTYAYNHNSWRGKSPPTFNNKIIDDYEEPKYDEDGEKISGHDSITFGGSTLFIKRYAYAVDTGIVKSVTDSSITIEHQWGECGRCDDEGNIIDLHTSYYDVTYYNVEYDKKLCDKIEVGDEVYAGQKLYKVKLFSNMDFSVYRTCCDPEAVDPHEFINIDDIEDAPEPAQEEETE